MTAPLHRTPSVALFGEFGVGNLGNDVALDTIVSAWQGLPVHFEILTHDDARAAAATGLPARSWRDTSGTSRRLRRRLGDVAALVRAVRRYDVIVVAGTGLLEGSRSGPGPSGTLRSLAVLSLAAWVLRVPVIWLAVGGARYRGRLTRLVVRLATFGTVRRSYRDHLTKAAVATCTRRARRDEVVCDVVFARSLPEPPDRPEQPGSPAADGGPPTVVLGVMDLPDRSGDPAEFAGERGRYVEELVKLGSALRARGCRLLAILGDDADTTNTTEVLRGVGWPEDEMVSFLPETSDFDAVLGTVGRADVVVASRFHLAVAATMTARPLVMLSHTDKVAQLLLELDLRDYVRSAYGFSAAEVEALVLDALADRVAIAARLTEHRERYRAVARTHLAEVGDLVTSLATKGSR